MKSFRFLPLLQGIVASLFVVICFYFVNQGIDAANTSGEVGFSYANYLEVAKWAVVAGLIIKGLLSSLAGKARL